MPTGKVRIYRERLLGFCTRAFMIAVPPQGLSKTCASLGIGAVERNRPSR
jgi:hypothetical protein